MELNEKFFQSRITTVSDNFEHSPKTFLSLEILVKLNERKYQENDIVPYVQLIEY